MNDIVQPQPGIAYLRPFETNNTSTNRIIIAFEIILIINFCFEVNFFIRIVSCIVYSNSQFYD